MSFLRTTAALWWALALAGVATMCWIGLTGFAFSDYEFEAAPAFKALTDGDLQGFIDRSPAYGGSLILRAPFAWVTGLLGGGELAVFRAVSIPCLLAGACLGVHLVGRMHQDGASWKARVLVLALVVLNPITIRGLDMGHPEEVLCAALAIGSVLAAARQHTIVAPVLLGLAIATKGWAVLAIAPVILSLETHRIRALVIGGVIPVLIMAPLLLFNENASGLVQSGTTTGSIFTPWQIFWFLGEHAGPVFGADGNPKDGYRTAPGYLSAWTHPAIALLTVPAGLLWWWRHRTSGWSPEQTLVLLALLFLLRCVLDPWNSVYYELPFLFALLSWEVICRRERLPVLTLACTVATWATFEWAPDVLSADGQSLFFLAWALPMCVYLARAAFARSVSAAVADEPRFFLDGSDPAAGKTRAERVPELT